MASDGQDIMFQSLTPTKIISAGLALGLFFVAFIYLFPGGAAIEILNAVFIGIAVSIAMLFRNVTIATILGRSEYKRAQRMALGLTVMWIGANLRTLQSILYRSLDDGQWLLNLPLGALITYLFIIGGYLQMTSPGFKSSSKFLHGMSRVRVAWAIVLSILTAAVLIWLQRSSILPGLLGL